MMRMRTNACLLYIESVTLPVPFLLVSLGVGDEGGREGMCPPNSGETIFFGQTSCNIRAVDIFFEQGRTVTLYFLTVFCFSFT